MTDQSRARLRGVRRRVGAFLVAGLSTAVALALLEGVLRGVGFDYHLSPTVQVGWPDPETIHSRYADDPDLFWVTQDYREKLRRARRTHPAVVFMGDSCTEFGSYPARTLEDLAARRAPVSTGIHLAAGGWSSEQGLAQLQRDVLPLHPRVVVIYYGWNDHWIALGPTDGQIRRARRWLWLAERSRLVQLGLKVWVGRTASATDPPLRVAPAQYRDHLLEMARLARSAGVIPIFVTAPSNHTAGHEPEYLLKRHVTRLSDLIPLHATYVDLTRQAARDGHAVLCDAAGALARSLERDHLFRADGIHFTDQGDVELGHIVSGCIASALASDVH